MECTCVRGQCVDRRSMFQFVCFMHLFSVTFFGNVEISHRAVTIVGGWGHLCRFILRERGRYVLCGWTVIEIKSRLILRQYRSCTQEVIREAAIWDPMVFLGTKGCEYKTPSVCGQLLYTFWFARSVKNHLVVVCQIPIASINALRNEYTWGPDAGISVHCSLFLYWNCGHVERWLPWKLSSDGMYFICLYCLRVFNYFVEI